MKKSCIHAFLTTCKVTLLGFGVLLLLGVVLAFTSAPFWIWYQLGTSRAGISGEPDYIIVLGGSGIPSGSGLMRTWYTAEAAREFPSAKVIIAMPGDTTDSLSAVCRMRDELILRGVPPGHILLEDSGTNTRAQAMYCTGIVRHAASGLLPSLSAGLRTTSNQQHERILLITSPEHVYRAVKTFEKVGFETVDALPAFEQDVESELSFSSNRLGGRHCIPDIGDNLTLRYLFWTQLHYEIQILREWMAISYYWLLGWL